MLQPHPRLAHLTLAVCQPTSRLIYLLHHQWTWTETGVITGTYSEQSLRITRWSWAWLRACERSWAVRISAPRSRGCSLPRSTAQSRTRSLRSIPLPAHLQFHPAPVKSLHARSNLKLLCMPKTCRFQPKPYASDTLSAWQTWSGFVAWLLRKKSASLLFCRWAAVAAWLDHTWYARIPQAMWLL